ncbi:TMhelix containing protein [Vibrio phage 1.154.O._10N.222.52.B12]|nr:TMhelix containing protein [Vibrio phage 1.154.O._10N.222.52.B12]
MSVVNEMITKFSFVGSLKPQESFNQNLKSSIKLLGGFALGVKGAVGLMHAWTLSVTEAIDPMVQLSRETGESVATLQELGYAASQNGSSLDAVMSSTKELTKRMGEFARTGGGPASEALLQLGINVRGANGQVKVASEVMMELTGRMKAFSGAEQADILDKLGIDPSMIQLLNQSGEAIDSLREKARALGTITKEQADAAASLNDSNTTLRFGFTALQNQIAVGLAPVIQQATEGFIEFLMAHKDLIRDGIKALSEGIIALGGFIDRMTPIALTAAAAFGVWKVATVGLGTALAAVFSPVYLIAGAIVGVALAIDDLVVAFRGGNSVIREFILDWTGFDITPALQKSVAAVKEFISTAIEQFKVLFNLISDFNFSEIWERMYQSFINVFSKIYDSLLSIGDFFKLENFSLPDLNPFSSSVDNAVDRVSGGSATSSSATVSQTNDIKIYTSDPVSAGKAVSDYSERQLKETRQYFDRGGM